MQLRWLIGMLALVLTASGAMDHFREVFRMLDASQIASRSSAGASDRELVLAALAALRAIPSPTEAALVYRIQWHFGSAILEYHANAGEGYMSQDARTGRWSYHPLAGVNASVGFTPRIKQEGAGEAVLYIDYTISTGDPTKLVGLKGQILLGRLREDRPNEILPMP